MEAQGYIHAWRQRWRRDRERDAQRAEQARHVAQRLARLLAQRYGATRVVLTGSLSRGEFRQGSDIDLAVEGVAPGELFRAGAEAERQAEGLEVDLVPLESATAAYREHVEHEGVVLHVAREERG